MLQIAILGTTAFSRDTIAIKAEAERMVNQNSMLIVCLVSF